MTYKGLEIGRVPTLSVIREFIIEKKMNLSAEEVYNHYEAMGWKTKKGTPIKSLETIVSSMNGIALMNEKREKEKAERDIEKKKRKLIRRRTIQIREENMKNCKYVKYNKQLKDPRWLAFRNFVFTVRGRECEICGSKDNLQIHHLLYRKNSMAWEYSTKDVAVLCSSCHSKLHGIKEK